MDPIRVPLALKIVMGVGLLFAVNEIAPGVAPMVLVLVALYLVLSQSPIVSKLIADSSRSFNSALSRPTLVGNVGRSAPMPH